MLAAILVADKARERRTTSPCKDNHTFIKQIMQYGLINVTKIPTLVNSDCFEKQVN